MKLVVDQPIAVSAAQAQAAFLDAQFYRRLGSLPNISAPEVRSLDISDGHAHLVLGYRFDGTITGLARRFVDPAKISWAQETDIDLATRRSQVRMVPDHYQGLFSFEAWYELVDDSPLDDSPVEDGPVEDGPVDNGPVDVGLVDNGPVDVGPVEDDQAGEGGAGQGPGPGAAYLRRGGHCRQHFEADLRAHIPLLGPLAERAIANGARDNLAATARLVEQHVAEAS